jgi:hypothetical protein
MTNDQASAFQPLPGTYEPSAIVQLPDGRFLVVEDEKDHPLHVLTFAVDGHIASAELTASLLQTFSAFWNLDDLEGLTLDKTGFVYAITSHSRVDDGDTKASREKLVRFRVEDDKVVQPRVADGLKRALTSGHPALAAAAKVKDVKGAGGLNIEALEFSADHERLLVGFRSPLRDGRALIASIENPRAIFEADEAPRVAAELEELDLGGHGIRGMSYVPSLGGFVVIGGPVSGADTQFDLWHWSGERGAPAHRVTVPGVQGMEHAEGVCPALVGGVERIIVVSDDGNRKAGRHARYLLLDPAQLRIGG